MTKIKVDEVDRRFCEKYCCAWSGGRCWHTFFGDEWCLWSREEIDKKKKEEKVKKWKK